MSAWSKRKKILNCPIYNRVGVQAPYFAFASLEGEGARLVANSYRSKTVGMKLVPCRQPTLSAFGDTRLLCDPHLGADERTYYLASKGKLSLFDKTHSRQEE